jgi:hypothetical protein
MGLHVENEGRPGVAALIDGSFTQFLVPVYLATGGSRTCVARRDNASDTGIG